jgi:coenzyme Q-binding protein COQ10
VPHFTTNRELDHSAAEMFALVADVEAYPEFVPLCSSMVVESRVADGDVESIVARMTVSYGLLHETFVSRVALDKGSLEITVDGMSGPFSHLKSMWRFEPIGESRSRIVFGIDYEFRSRALGFILGAALDRGFRRFAAAFEDRAGWLYGQDAPKG